MWFAIVANDVPNSLEARVANRPPHLARLQQMNDDGRLLLAGPFPAIASNDPGPAGFSGSLIIAEFASREAAIAWAAEDPYCAAGVFSKVTVKPFKKTFPN